MKGTKMSKKNLEYYLNLPYSYIIEWSDVDGCFLGSIVELERNMTCGQTREEVLANLKDALASYITISLDNNMEIPEPFKMEKIANREQLSDCDTKVRGRRKKAREFT